MEQSWMMFGHVKQVDGWTTIACHIYEHVYCCKVMTIVIYDMQLETIKAQCVLWAKLDKVMLEHHV